MLVDLRKKSAISDNVPRSAKDLQRENAMVRAHAGAFQRDADPRKYAKDLPQVTDEALRIPH